MPATLFPPYPPAFIHVSRSGVSHMLPNPAAGAVEVWDRAMLRARPVQPVAERGR